MDSLWMVAMPVVGSDEFLDSSIYWFIDFWEETKGVEMDAGGVLRSCAAEISWVEEVACRAD